MDRLNTIWIIQLLWLVLIAVWVIGRFTAKRVKQRESPVAYLGRIVIIVVLFEFLFNPAFAVGWLGERFLPASAALDQTAIAVTAIGVAVAIWARLYLGGNWSGTVTLKEGHELIQRGPYRWIRHPIYTGFDMAFLGTALAIGQWRGLAAFVVISIAHTMKARKEEAWLAREFGVAFEEHRRRTGMFLPRLVAR
jgi:protein-S-isoprenylcysteine O-methyltransferase Ste14